MPIPATVLREVESLRRQLGTLTNRIQAQQRDIARELAEARRELQTLRADSLAWQALSRGTDLPSRRCEIVLWRQASWRCEFWIVDDHGALRLYNGPRLMRTEPYESGPVAWRRAEEWRAAHTSHAS